MTIETDRAKQHIRAQVWDALDAAEAVQDDTAHGRIPNFKGAELAANRLVEHPTWQRAHTIKAVPDKAQHPVRTLALTEGKTVYMAVPKLATAKPFYLLDPANLTVPPGDPSLDRIGTYGEGKRIGA